MTIITRRFNVSTTSGQQAFEQYKRRFQMALNRYNGNVRFAEEAVGRAETYTV